MNTVGAHENTHSPYCILAVDDTPQNLQILAEIITQRLDCDLSFATDGRQALDSVKEAAPDLILLDVMMPGMTGFEVCAELKKSPATAAIPVIFLTAKSEVEDMVTGFERGAADYIVKPFNPAELIARVKTHLKIRESADIITQKNQELRQLVHILCHDLGNPIISIQRLIEMCEDPAMYPEAAKHIRQIAQSAMNIIHMVRQMRALEEGKQEIKLRPVPLLEACRQAQLIVHDRLQAKNISLTVSVPTELMVMAEETALTHSVGAGSGTNPFPASRSWRRRRRS
jgi:DNA-binding response OmpR family regulator